MPPSLSWQWFVSLTALQLGKVVAKAIMGIVFLCWLSSQTYQSWHEFHSTIVDEHFSVSKD